MRITPRSPPRAVPAGPCSLPGPGSTTATDPAPKFFSAPIRSWRSPPERGRAGGHRATHRPRVPRRRVNRCARLAFGGADRYRTARRARRVVGAQDTWRPTGGGVWLGGRRRSPGRGRRRGHRSHASASRSAAHRCGVLRQ
ncbi:hypothetical protein GQ55_5G516400 [Panicum hallii var. hallii]|uniref:Uncharacterized protein n=1 Tax=Panicum hallii var. hallii TaxID=1504633 RepID=A0A2T7DSH2_9POAL|nr:hypothetical protein GQ55_5G516400 [Panicum hallii var. hallii]